MKASPPHLVTMVSGSLIKCYQSMATSHHKHVGCLDHELRSPPSPKTRQQQAEDKAGAGGGMQEGSHGATTEQLAPARLTKAISNPSEQQRAEPWQQPQPPARSPHQHLESCPGQGWTRGRAEPRASKLLHGTAEVWVGAPRHPELAGGARSHPHALSQPATAALQFTGG